MHLPCVDQPYDLPLSSRSESERDRDINMSSEALTVFLELSDKLLYLVWARLLHDTQDEKETALHFRADDSTVCVDCDAWSVKVGAEPRNGRIPSKPDTGVFFEKPSDPQLLKLWLEYDRTHHTATLRCRSQQNDEQLSVWQNLFTAAVEWVLGQHQIARRNFAIRKIGVQQSIINAHPRRLKGSSLLHELVASSDREATAIDYLGADDDRVALSYREWHDASDRWAAQLAESFTRHSAGSNRTVPVLIPQSPELYIGLLAILKAGGSFCPLNVDAPVDRINFICGDVGAKVAITTTALKDRLAQASGVEVIVLDAPSPDSKPLSRFNTSPEPTDLAYVMYTSGSTGTPKGVGVSHLAVTQSLLAHDRYIPQFSRFLQFAAPTFDVSVFEIFFTFFRSSTLVACERTKMLNDLPAIMNTMAVDAAELTPTVAGGLLRTRDAVPGLKLLLTIGEMLTAQVMDEFGGGEAKPSMLWAMYGPTECAIHCTLQPAIASHSPLGNIGIVMDTVSAFVIESTEGTVNDSSMRILPIGEVGELVIGGPQLATGYLNRPDQNDKAFIMTSKYGRLYRTGDKARLSSNGLLECLGRISAGQVKIRGQRVELGEVEQAVAKVEGCGTSIAEVVTGQLVVWCVAEASFGVTKQTVLEKAKEWLPQYMLPSDVVFLDNLPQLPSGKVDRRRLEQEYEQNKANLSTEEFPETQDASPALIHVLQSCKNLTSADVNPNAPLVSAGIDSLLAIRLATALRNLGHVVNASDILESPNARRLAEVLEARYSSDVQDGQESEALNKKLASFESSALDRELLRDRKNDIERVLPATPVQEAMLAELASDSRRYCNWIEFELAQDVSLDGFKTAYKQLVTQTEILRSGFCHTPEAGHSYGQIVWCSEVVPEPVQVQELSKTYSLDDPHALLHPLRVEMLCADNTTRVLFQIPHFLYDGWAIDLLVQDFDDLLRQKQPTQRPQFSVVSTYFASLRDREEYRAAQKHWSDTLQQIQPSSLPNFTGYTGQNSTHATTIRTLGIVPSQVTEKARSSYVSPQTFFQAALAIILRSYLGTDEVIVGTVNSGRTLPLNGIESTIGPCVATLPLKVDFAAHKDVASLLEAIHSSNRGMAKHCMMPLQDLNRLAGLSPGQSLFDVLFTWQQTTEDIAAKSELLIRQVDTVDQLEFPLLVEVEPQGTELVVKATFDDSVLPKAQVDVLLLQLEELTSYILRDDNVSLDSVATAYSEDALSIIRPTVLAEGNLPNPARSVSERAKRDPDLPAISFFEHGEEHILTYRELNDSSNRAAHQLRALGVGRNEFVGICMEKSHNLYIYILAILKCEAGYLPLTPDTPTERIGGILAEAEVKICLRNSTTPELAPVDGCRFVDLRESEQGDQSTDDLKLPHNGSDVAYAIFTSGSTGKPKGVLVTMDNLASNLLVLSRLYPHSTSSRLLQSCSQAFDVSVFEIFFTWFTGMCLCTAVKDEIFEDIEAFIRLAKVTHLSLTPTVASLINPDNVPNVEFLVTAGEGVTDHVHRTWADRGLWQGYGPSETTNICSVLPKMTLKHAINNVGPGFENTSTIVMEKNSQGIVPRGGVGEFVFGGDQVFKGYLQRPELNGQKIINHPEFGRLYRSGDLGRVLTDGSLSFAGRADDQIKLRGHRIELGEITSCATENPGVAECVSMACESSNGKDAARLVTFFVPQQHKSRKFGCLASHEESRSMVPKIFENLTARLPHYTVPSNIIPISALPMTPSSKVDKRLLTRTFHELSSADLDATAYKAEDADNDEAEWSETEQAIADVLVSTLDLSRSDIGRNTSFFGLGVDSIKAIAVSKKLNSMDFGSIPVSAIMRNPSVARLAKQLRSSTTADARPTPDSDPISVLRDVFPKSVREGIVAEVKRSGRSATKILPCTPLQEAMLAAGSSTDSSTYINVTLFDIHCDVDRLRDVWNRACERQEILRTCFSPTQESQVAFAQVVLDKHTPRWEDVSCADDQVEEMVRATTHNILTDAAMHLEVPLCFALIKTPSRQMFAFCCHHALYDGVALSVLYKEIEQLYNGEELAPAPTADAFLAAMVATDPSQSDTFWSEHLQAFEPSSLPNLTTQTISQLSATRQHRLFKQDISLSSAEVNQACRSLSTSLLSATQAAWAKLVTAYLGELDVCFGNVFSGRTLPIDGLDDLVAPCFNTLPIRSKISTSSTNLELMQQLQNFNAEVLPYQMTPLRRIQSKFSSDGKRLFDTLFILQQADKDLDSKIWTLKDDIGSMDLPLVCEIAPNAQDDRMSVLLHYDTSYVTEAEVTKIFECYAVALKSCLFAPSKSAQSLEDLSPDLLSVSGAELTALPAQDDRLMHSGFESNVEKSSEKNALDFLFEDGSRTTWTFNELNKQASKVANALMKVGLQREDAVPIHLPKSPMFYAAILGVLKAGGAFTPFDPSLPADRKKFMFQELGAQVVICKDAADVSWCENAKALDIASIDSESSDLVSVPTITESSLAYRLYTSGSTGKPKAVSVEHCNPVHTVDSSRSIIPWTAESRLLQYAATTFDMCYYDCFLAWTFGFCLCAAEQAVMFNDLASTIKTLDASLLDLTPSVAKSLKQKNAPSVQYLYCIGEAMSQEIVDEWQGKCVNSFGPTEAAFCCTIDPVSNEQKPAIIGKPFPTAKFTILSPDGSTVMPILGAGELHIEGPQVAREYHANEKLTSERFITWEGRRLYKTGDRARMLSNGSFEFLGRIDDQVKIRGLRVELDEISTVVRQAHETITGATTLILRTDDSAAEQLVTVIASRDAENADVSKDIKTAAIEVAKKQLPAYMVPNLLLIVEKIPLSAAGKVDRKTIRAMFQQHMSTTRQNVADDGNYEWSQAAKEVRKILSTLSKQPIESIKYNTTIYQLGLDSISAVQIASQLRQKGHKIMAGEVLRHPSCDALASRLSEETPDEVAKPKKFDFAAFDVRHRSDVSRKLKIEDGDLEAVRPCTPLQRGLISQFMQSDDAMYFNYMQVELVHSIPAEDYQTAFQTTFEKHAVLRSGFIEIGDKDSPFAMITHRSDGFAVNVEVSQEEPWTKDRAHDWQLKSARDSRSSLDQPPWRIVLVKSQSQTTMHIAMLHALYDAQSLRTMLDDFSAAAQGKALSPATDMNETIGAILQGSQVTETSRTFWKEVGDDVFVNRFPNMHPLQTEVRGKAIEILISEKSFSELEQVCRKADTTLQAAGQAAWARLLSSYLGEVAVTFGVVLSGREIPSASDVAFPCITTVPVACQSKDNNREMLTAMLNLNAALRDHQFTPLAEIQRLVGHADSALFDTMFAFQKFSSADDHEQVWKMVDDIASDNYSVSVELEPSTDDQLLYRVTYEASLLPADQAKLLLKQFEIVLHDLVFTPDGESSHDCTGQQALYSITPPKDAAIPTEIELLHEFVEASTRKHPDKIALEFATSFDEDKVESRTWTYAELNEQGNRMANLLVDQGIEPGNLIAVCFDKCAKASFAMLGILKAGCAFVAIDPTAPDARKSYIVGDSHAKAFVSMEAISRLFADEIKVPIINLDGDKLESSSPSTPKLARKISPQDGSYCLYTSGTTGNPKGCELTHENAVQAMMSFQRLFAGHWDDESRWLQFASFHFDVSVLEQYWSWAVGIRMVSAPRDLILGDIPGTIQALGITHIDLTPSLARTVSPEDAPSLCRGVFITGGESLKQEILDVWGPKNVIYNGYGPTEATIGCTMYTRVPAVGKPSNIGPQFDNVGSYVLKPSTETPVLRGAVGELCVSGKLVGKGYLNRPDLTDKAFPTLKSFGERVYRTGDLVRILHNGDFQFLGRADDQVKLRGQRLEIGEINSVIKQGVDVVQDVATLVLKHAKQQKEQLVSFIATNSSAKRDVKLDVLTEESQMIADVREACQSRLAGYMVPTHIIPLTTIPLSANHKADAKQLKALYDALSGDDLQKLAGSSADDKALSQEESKIRDVLVSLPQIEDSDVNRTASVFELGLDSISVIGFSTALKKAGFRNAHPSMVMRNSSIARLAKALQQSGKQPADPHVLAAKQSISAHQHRYLASAARSLGLKSDAIEAIAPCTPLQAGMITRSLESDAPVYFNTFNFEILENADLTKLRAAWKQVFLNTQALRLQFASCDAGYVQVVANGRELQWTEHPCQNEEAVDGSLSSTTHDWWAANRDQFATPFELVLIRSPSRIVLSLHLFHALYDGNSLPMILESVMNAYDALTPEEVDKRPQFFDILPHGPLKQTVEAKDFFTNHLQRATSQQFPRSAEVKGRSTHALTRSIATGDRYGKARKALNASDQAIMQACWAAALQHHFSGSVTLGIVVYGRSIPFDGADKVIGPLFNTIPCNIAFRNGQSWEDAVGRCQEYNVEALPFQHTPLRDVLKWTRHRSDKPLFENLFVFQKGTQDADQWSNNEVWKLVDDVSPADYPVNFEVLQQDDGTIKLTLVTQAEVFGEKEASRLVDDFEKCFSALLQDPQASISETVGDIAESEHTDSRAQETTSAQSAVSSDFKWIPEAEKIRDAIADLAGIAGSDVGPQTSIFETGLDSIDAIKLSASLKKRGINLPVSGIMRNLTVEKMSQQVAKATTNGVNGHTNGTEASSLDRLQSQLQEYAKDNQSDSAEIEAVLPATPLQEAMVAETVNSNFERYFNHDVLELSADTDFPRLKKAWTEVLKNSPILRTTFLQIEDPAMDATYAQLIHKFSDLEWTEREVGNENDVHELPKKISAEAATKGVNANLFRLTLVACGDKRFLILSISHALYDGWALALLHQDVAAAYKDVFKARPDNASALREILEAAGPGADTFWKDFLGEAENAPFPKIEQRAEEPARGVHREETISRKSLDEVNAFCKKSGISMQALAQTCWSLVLASYTKSLDVIFGVVLSGRDSEASNDVMFPTMNTVAVRAVLHGTKQEMLSYVQDNMTNIRQYQHFPLRKAQALAGKQGSSLFDTLFIYQRRPEIDDSGSKGLYESVGGQSDVEYPVCVELEGVGDGLIWRCACEASALDKKGSNQLLQRLEDTLESIMEDVDAPVLDFTNQGISICGLPSFVKSMDVNMGGQHESEAEQLPPSGSWTETELAIRRVLADVAKIPESGIGKSQTIFNLGLDSISTIKITALLKKQGIVINSSALIRAGTIPAIAEAVTTKPKAGKTSIFETAEDEQHRLYEDEGFVAMVDTYDLAKSPRGLWHPATSGQVHMLSMWQKTLGRAFHFHFKWHIRGRPVLQNAIQKAWNRIRSEEPALRAFFAATRSEKVPIVYHTVLKPSNLTSDIGDKFEEAARYFSNVVEMRRPERVLEGNDTDWLLTFRMNHALYDANTMPRFLRRFQDLLNDKEPARQIDIPVIKPTYRFQEADRKSYWQNYLAGYVAPANPMTQPQDATRNVAEVFKQNVVSDVAGLRTVARIMGVTIESLLYSAYAKVYHKFTCMPGKEDDFDTVIGIYMSNRPDEMQQGPHTDTSGPSAMPTLNMVPLRVQGSKQVQQPDRDINELRSNPTLGSVGLWEIDRWTNVKIDTFVNIINRRSSTEHPYPDSKEEPDLWETKVEDVTEQLLGAVFDRAEWVFKSREGTPPLTLSSNPVANSYLHSVDIEFAIHDNRIDMGLFCPAGMLDYEPNDEELLNEPHGAVTFFKAVTEEINRITEDGVGESESERSKSFEIDSREKEDSGIA